GGGSSSPVRALTTAKTPAAAPSATTVPTSAILPPILLDATACSSKPPGAVTGLVGDAIATQSRGPDIGLAADGCEFTQPSSSARICSAEGGRWFRSFAIAR